MLFLLIGYFASDLQCMSWAFHRENLSRNALELLGRLELLLSDAPDNLLWEATKSIFLDPNNL